MKSTHTINTRAHPFAVQQLEQARHAARTGRYARGKHIEQLADGDCRLMHRLTYL